MDTQIQPAKPPKIGLGFIIAAGIVALVSIVFLLFFTVASVIKNTDSYHVAIKAIENNPKIVETTGGIKCYGVFPTGNWHYAGSSGSANLTINVLGNTKDVVVNVTLSEEGDSPWMIEEMVMNE